MATIAEKNADLLDDLVDDWQREIPGIDVRAMAVVGRIIHLGALLEQDANQALKPLKLRYTDFDVLATLRRRGAPYKLTPKVLRRSILISSSAMTACLDRLEKAGFVAREPDPDDRRGTMVRLTGKGVKLVDKAVVRRFDVAREAVSRLSEQEFSRLADLLRKLVLHQE